MRRGALTLANGYSGSPLYQAVQIQAVAIAIVLFSRARYLTLTLPFFTQVHATPSPPPPATAWVPGNLMLGTALKWTSIPSKRGVEILLVASCYRNLDKL